MNDKGEVAVQVMNIGPMEVTLYKGTTIANFVPRRCLRMLKGTSSLVLDLRKTISVVRLSSICMEVN